MKKGLILPNFWRRGANRLKFLSIIGNPLPYKKIWKFRLRTSKCPQKFKGTPFVDIEVCTWAVRTSASKVSGHVQNTQDMKKPIHDDPLKPSIFWEGGYFGLKMIPIIKGTPKTLKLKSDSGRTPLLGHKKAISHHPSNVLGMPSRAIVWRGSKREGKSSRQFWKAIRGCQQTPSFRCENARHEFKGFPKMFEWNCLSSLPECSK